MNGNGRGEDAGCAGGSAGSWRGVADVSPVKSSLVRKADAWDLRRTGDGTDSVGDDAGFIYGPLLCTLMYCRSVFRGVGRVGRAARETG